MRLKISNEVEDIVNLIIDQLKIKDKIVLGLPGGNSIIPVLNLLKHKKKKELDWNRIEIFLVDERLVPLTDKDSNFKLLNDHLFKDLILSNKISAKNIHPFVSDEGRSDLGLLNYQRELVNVGGKFDIIILGVGEDGHIASLFPHHKLLYDNSPFFVIIEDSPKKPSKRISSSKLLIQNSDIICCLFMGEKKQNSLNNFSDNSVTIDECPAKILKESSSSLYIFTDLIKKNGT